MTWLRSIGTFEYILIGCFLLFYILYIVRIILIARKLKSGMRSVFYKFILRSAYFTLLIFALLGPSFGNVKNEIKSVSREIYFLVDLSLSMNANDIHPSRIEKAKLQLKKMTEAFATDRIGLIGFSSVATVLCPPTFDHSALQIFIESLNTDLPGSEGSDISTGLKLAMNQFKSSAPTSSKIVILLTDGEDYGNKAMDIAQNYNSKKIELLVLGIGTNEGSRIPFNGTFKKDSEGEIVITKLNSENLNELANAAEGNYFEINSSTQETESLISSVLKIEGSVMEVKEIDASANKYLYFLIFALFLIVLDVLITIRTVKI